MFLDARSSPAASARSPPGRRPGSSVAQSPLGLPSHSDHRRRIHLQMRRNGESHNPRMVVAQRPGRQVPLSRSRPGNRESKQSKRRRMVRLLSTSEGRRRGAKTRFGTSWKVVLGSVAVALLLAACGSSSTSGSSSSSSSSSASSGTPIKIMGLGTFQATVAYPEAPPAFKSEVRRHQRSGRHKRPQARTDHLQRPGQP